MYCRRECSEPRRRASWRWQISLPAGNLKSVCADIVGVKGAGTVANVERLKMIQAAIERMARNCFALKGWAVTLVAALLGLSAADSDRSFAVIALYVLVALAGLDAYYLSLERAYRVLYDQAVSDADTAWSLAPRTVRVPDLLRALASPSVYLLYGVSLASSIVVLAAT
jgi:hypothetical protein